MNLENLKTFGIGALVALVCGLILLGIYYADQHDTDRWQDYAAAHHCEAKGTKKGQLEPVLGGKGGVTWTSDQTIYVCDGGEIVIR
jgi:hypothetical protein